MDAGGKDAPLKESEAAAGGSAAAEVTEAVASDGGAGMAPQAVEAALHATVNRLSALRQKTAA